MMEVFRQHRHLILVEGTVFIVLGILAIILPGPFTFGVELVLGWLLVVSGVFQGYRTIKMEGTAGWTASLLSAALSIVVGSLLLAFPIAGVVAMTILLSLFFLFEGIAKIYWGFMSYPYPLWGWLIFSGIVSFSLAAIIWAGWPSTALWVIGLLLGINFLIFGISLLSIAAIIPKKKDEGG